MIKTKSRCLILDPNGDFRKINKIDDTLWSNKKNIALEHYDKMSGRGKFTSESLDEFKRVWQDVLKQLYN